VNIIDILSPPVHTYVDQACCPSAARLARATDEFTVTC